MDEIDFSSLLLMSGACCGNVDSVNVVIVVVDPMTDGEFNVRAL